MRLDAQNILTDSCYSSEGAPQDHVEQPTSVWIWIGLLAAYHNGPAATRGGTGQGNDLVKSTLVSFALRSCKRPAGH
jgi:hypothetical protein